jgi:hypothetical protein
VFVKRETLWTAVIAAALIAVLAPTSARATFRYVDDDNVQCPAAPYRTIGDALHDFLPGDEIFVCGGTYPEQIVLEHFVPIHGVLDIMRNRPVIAPVSLPATRPTIDGENPVRAGVIVDSATIRIENVVIDVSGAQDGACSPILAGMYARNASGMVNNVEIRGAAIPSQPNCDTGVGMLVEAGSIQVFARLVKGRAAMNARELAVRGFQRVGVAVIGEKASLKARDSLVAGSGKGMPFVQHGFQFSNTARGRLQDVRVKDVGTSQIDRMGTGVLAFGTERVRTRRLTVENAQTGVFLVGDRNRIAGGIFTDIGSDGVVVIGNRNRVLKNDIAVSSVDGVFVDGDDNLVRGGAFSDMPIGIWAFAGDGNRAEQVTFLRVPEPARIGGVRNLTPDFAAAFTTACANALDCDDANECTTDTCDVNGTCGNAAVTDGTPCTGGACTAGVCQ